MVIPGLVWDACSLLNLLATDYADDILVSLRCPSYVAREVRETEVLSLRPFPETDKQELQSADLGPLLVSERYRKWNSRRRSRRFSLTMHEPLTMAKRERRQ